MFDFLWLKCYAPNYLDLYLRKRRENIDRVHSHVILLDSTLFAYVNSHGYNITFGAKVWGMF